MPYTKFQVKILKTVGFMMGWKCDLENYQDFKKNLTYQSLEMLKLDYSGKRPTDSTIRILISKCKRQYQKIF